MTSRTFARSLISAAVVSAAALAGHSAQASLAVDVDGTGLSVGCPACGTVGTTHGYTFRLDAPLQIAGLGAWDTGSDGLGQPTEVGLYTDAGQLIIRIAIDDATSTAVASAWGAALGGWRVAPIAPVWLAAGDYRLGQVFFDSLPELLVGTGVRTLAGLNLTGGATSSAHGMGLAAPLDAAPQPVFGPTLLAVHEPAAAGLALLALLAGAAATRWRRPPPRAERACTRRPYWSSGTAANTPPHHRTPE